MTARAFLAGLNSSLDGASLPFGYTITVWGSGHLLSDLRGSPDFGGVLLFAAGALLVFGALKWAVRDAETMDAKLAADPHLVRAGVTQLVAIAAAFGGATLAGALPSIVAWPLGGGAATALYLAGTGFELGRRAGEDRATA